MWSYKCETNSTPNSSQRSSFDHHSVLPPSSPHWGVLSCPCCRSKAIRVAQPARRHAAPTVLPYHHNYYQDTARHCWHPLGQVGRPFPASADQRLTMVRLRVPAPAMPSPGRLCRIHRAHETCLSKPRPRRVAPKVCCYLPKAPRYAASLCAVSNARVGRATTPCPLRWFFT
jgi:hypothetical protein